MAIAHKARSKRAGGACKVARAKVGPSLPAGQTAGRVASGISRPGNVSGRPGASLIFRGRRARSQIECAGMTTRQSLAEGQEEQTNFRVISPTSIGFTAPSLRRPVALDSRAKYENMPFARPYRFRFPFRSPSRSRVRRFVSSKLLDGISTCARLPPDSNANANSATSWTMQLVAPLPQVTVAFSWPSFAEQTTSCPQCRPVAVITLPPAVITHISPRSGAAGSNDGDIVLRNFIIGAPGPSYLPQRISHSNASKFEAIRAASARRSKLLISCTCRPSKRLRSRELVAVGSRNESASLDTC